MSECSPTMTHCPRPKPSTTLLTLKRLDTLACHIKPCFCLPCEVLNAKLTLESPLDAHQLLTIITILCLIVMPALERFCSCTRLMHAYRLLSLYKTLEVALAVWGFCNWTCIVKWLRRLNKSSSCLTKSWKFFPPGIASSMTSTSCTRLTESRQLYPFCKALEVAPAFWKSCQLHSPHELWIVAPASWGQVWRLHPPY